MKPFPSFICLPLPCCSNKVIVAGLETAWPQWKGKWGSRLWILEYQASSYLPTVQKTEWFKWVKEVFGKVDEKTGHQIP